MSYKFDDLNNQYIPSLFWKIHLNFKEKIENLVIIQDSGRFYPAELSLYVGF